MKKLALIFPLLFAACAVSSNIQNYRFAGETETHTFNIVQNAIGTSWTLIIDNKEIVSSSIGLFKYEDIQQADWNGKKVVLERHYSPGFFGIGAKNVFTVFVENEKVAHFEF